MMQGPACDYDERSPLAIALFVLPIKASDYPFGIFNVTSLNRFKLPLVVKCCGHVQNHLTI
jgi:hypothetical protein